jgi:hypothetical protein
MIEPKSFRILGGIRMCQALNVTLTQVAGSVRDLLRCSAKPRIHQFRQSL